MSKRKQSLEKEYKLTEQEVIDIIQKANDGFETLKELDPSINELSFASYAWNLSRNGAFNPFDTNSTLKELNIDVLVPDKKKIDKALKDPANHEGTLIGYNQYFYFSNMSYKRSLEIMKALPAFDLSIRCINIEKPEDRKSGQYIEDNKVVKDFLQKFDYRKEFKEAIWNMLMSETCFVMFRKFKNKYKLQYFPNKYAMLTGEWEYGLLYDIDVNYFINNTMVDIDMFPDSIKDKVNKVYDSKKQGGYRPSSSIDKRTGTYANWIETSPEEGFTAFKFNTAHNLNVPFLSAVLPEMAILPIIEMLQLDQSMAAAKKIVAADVPYIKDTKGAGLTNKVAIEATELKKFVDTVAHGLQGLVKLLYTPTEKSTGIEFKNTDENGYSNFLAVTSQLLSGGTSSVNLNNRENAIQTQINQNMQELVIKEIYPQFNDFLNYYVNNATKKYKFEFRFSGTNSMFDRDRMQKEAFALAGKGIPSLNRIANAFGYNKYELEDELDEYNASGFADKLQVLLNENTMKSEIINDDTNKNGRPQKEESELTESGEATRAAGNNIAKGGNI